MAGVYAARMCAYSAYWYNREGDMDRAPEYLNPNYGEYGSMIDVEGKPAYEQVPSQDSPRPLREIPALTTNVVSQWSLNYMETCRLREMSEE